ncbi:MAG: hypothetical protein RBT65_07365 [Methanolobus sp.]|nr:hypothetical protein [Methanolobus sp.]
MVEKTDFILVHDYIDLLKTIDALQEKANEIKKDLFQKMIENSIEKQDFGVAKLTIVKESSSFGIDLKELEKQEEQKYNYLVQKYPKVTKRNAYLKITIPQK